MLISSLIATVSTVLTVANYTISSVNTANIAYDKAVVGESLQQMSQTQQLLEQKALAETDPVLRQKKLAIAKKLGSTQEKLSNYQDKLITQQTTREGLALAKGLVTGNMDQQIVGIVETAADQAVALKGAHKSKVDDVTVWSQLAKSDLSIDAEIMKVEARQQLQDLTNLDRELAAMVQGLQEQEKQKKISSDEFEGKLGQIIEESPQLQNKVLQGLDVDADFDATNDEIKVAQNTPSPDSSPPPSSDTNPLVGDWIIVAKSDGSTISDTQTDNVYRFEDEKNFQFRDIWLHERNYHHTYTFDGAEGMIATFEKISAPYENEMPEMIEDWEQFAAESFTPRKFVFDQESGQIKYYVNYSSDPNFYLVLEKK